ADGMHQVSTGRFLQFTAIGMHGRRWTWAISQRDTTQRPLISPSGVAMNPTGIMTAAGAADGPVASLLSLEGALGRRGSAVRWCCTRPQALSLWQGPSSGRRAAHGLIVDPGGRARKGKMKSLRLSGFALGAVALLSCSTDPSRPGASGTPIAFPGRCSPLCRNPG
ncbi:MAG: hypothetical protein ACRDJG_06785, partial [Actinomycetota bacterium]